MRMCCILFSVEIPELVDEVLETKVVLNYLSHIQIKLVEEIAESSSRLGEMSVHYVLTMQNLSNEDEKNAFIDKIIALCISKRDSLLLAGCHFCKSKPNEKRGESLALIAKAYSLFLSIII